MTGDQSSRDPRLLEYLRARRWFGEKGRANLAAEVLDAIPVTWPMSEERFLVMRVRVTGDGEPATYQLFVREGDTSFADALEIESFRRGLIEAFAAGCTFGDAGTRWAVQSVSDAPLKVPADAPIRLSTAEQSNSSVFVGTQAVLKLFRKVAPGIHPDIELTRFLTIDRRFLHTPALLGTIHFADEQGAWAAGMLQELVPGATDAWTHALECAKPWFMEGKRSGDVPFTGEAERLGEITRAMHDTLASGDHGSGFECQAATSADIARWTESTVRMLRRAMHTARREGEVAGIEGRVRALADAVSEDAGAIIRIHGDYHLGQVLRSVTGAFLIVDFEGEPSRPLEERRRPHSPLRDVAGMLRSFSYAAAVRSRESGQKTGLSARGEDWERAVRAAFLTGYFGAESREPKARSLKPILPESRENAERLITLFEAEKAFYELQYELDHRPDWAWIPLRAIEALRA